MKKILIGLMGLMGMMGMVACHPETTEVPCEREIFYTVSDDSGMPGFSGTTVHLNTEAEWDALLDNFCNLTREGEQVIFCGTHTSQAKGNSNGTPTSINTQNREQLKDWMKEMEKNGKTVVVSFDEGTGTWYGRAYANLAPEEGQTEELTCTGELTLVAVPAIEEQPMPGAVWALQVSTDSTLILTVHGMMLWTDDTESATMLDGVEVTMSGMVSTHTDRNGMNYKTIELTTADDTIVF